MKDEDWSKRRHLPWRRREQDLADDVDDGLESLGRQHRSPAHRSCLSQAQYPGGSTTLSSGIVSPLQVSYVGLVASGQNGIGPFR